MEKYFGIEDEEDVNGIPCPADIKDIRTIDNREQYQKGFSFDFIPQNNMNSGGFNF